MTESQLVKSFFDLGCCSKLWIIHDIWAHTSKQVLQSLFSPTQHLRVLLMSGNKHESEYNLTSNCQS